MNYLNNQHILSEAHSIDCIFNIKIFFAFNSCRACMLESYRTLFLKVSTCYGERACSEYSILSFALILIIIYSTLTCQITKWVVDHLRSERFIWLTTLNLNANKFGRWWDASITWATRILHTFFFSICLKWHSHGFQVSITTKFVKKKSITISSYANKSFQKIDNFESVCFVYESTIIFFNLILIIDISTQTKILVYFFLVIFTIKKGI